VEIGSPENIVIFWEEGGIIPMILLGWDCVLIDQPPLQTVALFMPVMLVIIKSKQQYEI
jgi:hypothetical protein